MIERQNSAVKKVPIRIVHSEGVTEKENCPFLQHSDSAAVEAEAPGVNRLSSLGAAGQDSVFCAFNRQKEPDSLPAAQTEPKPQRDTYMTTIRDHINSNCQQPPQPTDEPSSNRTAVTTGVTAEDQKREELARDIMGKDKSLADILDQSKMKTTMDLMEGIFPQGEQLLEEAHQRRKVPSKQSVSRPAEERSASHFSFLTCFSPKPTDTFNFYISHLLKFPCFTSAVCILAQYVQFCHIHDMHTGFRDTWGKSCWVSDSFSPETLKIAT